jgi:predicted metal-dependent enzyme (double-stranded beta helix superfamily)
LLRTPYRFHRFLTEVEDALETATNETDCLPELRRLVRRLMVNSYWLQTQTVEPNPETGTGVLML